MSHQLTFADSEFSTKRRQTRKEIFLSRMEQILPWQNMTAVIEPFYPKAGNGRRPYPLETMLRIHCMQHWYNLSDGAMEDALASLPALLFCGYHWTLRINISMVSMLGIDFGTFKT
ncbi:transposase [Escherichia coli]|nr:transposase [Escherichia coli]